MTDLLGFILGRSMVSAGLSLAMQSSPDLLYDRVCANDSKKASQLSSRIEQYSAWVQFTTRPMWGAASDWFGRRPILICGCLVSFLARFFAGSFPGNEFVYVLYRVVNGNALSPVMQASSALLGDACHGKTTERFIVVNRRLWMLLAVVRIAATRWAAAKHSTRQVEKQDEHAKKAYTYSPETLMKYAALLSLSAGLVFASPLVKETVNNTKAKILKPNQSVARAVMDVWINSSTFFFQNKQRAVVALALVFQFLPLYSGTATGMVQRYRFKWGPEERALMSNSADLAEVFVPLVVNEMLGFRHPKDASSVVWMTRFQTFALLNVAFTPDWRTTLINPFIERLVSTQHYFDIVLSQIAHGSGDGALESAMSSLQFPLGVLVPPFLQTVGNRFGDRAPFVFLVACSLFNGELARRGIWDSWRAKYQEGGNC